MMFRRHGGEIVDSRCLSQMLELLQSPDVYERLFARDSLCLQVDAKVLSTSIGPIISLLDAADTLSKRTALRLLAQLQPPTLLIAILPRILALLGDSDGEVRRAVLPVLQALPRDVFEDEAHAAHLFSFLGPEQGDWRVRVTALYALPVLPPARLAEELDGVLAQVLVGEERSEVRFAALDVLQALLVNLSSDAGVGAALMEEEQQQSEGEYDFGDPLADGLRAAAAAKASPTAAASVDGNNSRRGATTSPLLAPVLAAQATRVVERFADVDDRFVRWKAMSVIGCYPGPLLRDRQQVDAVLAALLRCLEHEYACTRGAGLLALGRLCPGLVTEEALRAMAACLRDEEPAVRWACVHALKKQVGVLEGHAGAAAVVAEEAGRVMGGEGEDVWVAREAHRLLVRLPAAVVSQEAAQARAAFEARSEAAVDEVVEEAEEASGGLGERYYPD